jgi:hypothetical protein
MPMPLAAVFDALPDPRRQTKNKLHALTDILVITTCAVIGGAETWAAIAEYGRTKADFFRRFLPLGNGIPSADTFGRVFAKLSPGSFTQAFGRWMAAACEATGLVPVAIDGKSARASKRNTATGCLTVVTAWATENRLVLGQVAVPDGSNEIAAIPELLKVLELKGGLGDDRRLWVPEGDRQAGAGPGRGLPADREGERADPVRGGVRGVRPGL